MSVSARSADAVMRKRLTAFNTGVAPSRMRPYIMMVRGASDPTSMRVVFHFLNGKTKAMPRRADERRTQVRQGDGAQSRRLRGAEVQRRVLEAAIEALQACADRERCDRYDIGELAEYHQR